MMRSIAMPSLSHHTDSLDKPNRALPEAKGAPLSVRMAAGRPNSLKTRSNRAKAKSERVEAMPSQASR